MFEASLLRTYVCFEHACRQGSYDRHGGTSYEEEARLKRRLRPVFCTMRERRQKRREPSADGTAPARRTSAEAPESGCAAKSVTEVEPLWTQGDSACPSPSTATESSTDRGAPVAFDISNRVS